MNIFATVLVPTLVFGDPVVEIGEGSQEVHVYQHNPTTCVFKFTDPTIPLDALYFYEPVDCRNIAFQYRRDSK